MKTKSFTSIKPCWGVSVLGRVAGQPLVDKALLNNGHIHFRVTRSDRAHWPYLLRQSVGYLHKGPAVRNSVLTLARNMCQSVSLTKHDCDGSYDTWRFVLHHRRRAKIALMPQNDEEVPSRGDATAV